MTMLPVIHHYLSSNFRPERAFQLYHDPPIRLIWVLQTFFSQDHRYGIIMNIRRIERDNIKQSLQMKQPDFL